MRKILYSVLAAGTMFAIYLASDSGPVGQAMVAVCPVRIDDECLLRMRDGGLSVNRYERLRFPAFVTFTDAGTEIDIPRMRALSARCVEVLDWSDCSLDSCAAHPGICGLWDAGVPVRRALQRKCLRANFSKGLPCPYANGDPVGDLNVSLRARRSNPAQCEEVECSVLAGENPETDL
jgi:hypothetical protein